jgi:hypothetical protein
LQVDTAPATDASTTAEQSTVVDTPPEAPPTTDQTADESGFEPKVYTVKVRGEELQVPEDELVKGYQRQQDYTRSKQELAALRQELGQAEAIVRALEADPARTITALATAYEVPLDTRVNETDEYGGFDDMDPDARRIQELEARVQNQEQAAVMQAIERELSALESRYGDVDREALLDFAYRTNAPNLTMAYASMNFDDVFAQAGKTQEQQTTDEQIVEQKRTAGLMEGGSSTAQGSVSQAPKQISSVREAWLAAKDQLAPKR